MYCMKYSVGFSNSKKSKFSSTRKGRTVRTLGKSVSGFGFNTYKNVKKYSSNRIGSTKLSRRDKKGGKNPEFKKRIKKVLYIILGVGFFTGCIGLIVLGAYLKKIGDALPSPDQLIERYQIKVHRFWIEMEIFFTQFMEMRIGSLYLLTRFQSIQRKLC